MLAEFMDVYRKMAMVASPLEVDQMEVWQVASFFGDNDPETGGTLTPVDLAAERIRRAEQGLPPPRPQADISDPAQAAELRAALKAQREARAQA